MVRETQDMMSESVVCGTSSSRCKKSSVQLEAGVRRWWVGTGMVESTTALGARLCMILRRRATRHGPTRPLGLDSKGLIWTEPEGLWLPARRAR